LSEAEKNDSASITFNIRLLKVFSFYYFEFETLCSKSSCFFPRLLGVFDWNQNFVTDSAVVGQQQPCLKRDLVWRSSENVLHKWIHVRCLGSEADCILGRLLDSLLCVLTNILIKFSTFSTSVYDFTQTKFTWLCINSLIEMSTINMMNEQYCILEFNYAYLNKSINNNRTACLG